MGRIVFVLIVVYCSSTSLLNSFKLWLIYCAQYAGDHNRIDFFLPLFLIRGLGRRIDPYFCYFNRNGLKCALWYIRKNEN